MPNDTDRNKTLINPEFIDETFTKYKIIYAYELDYEEEKGYVKVGHTGIDESLKDLNDNHEFLNVIAKKRIKQQDKSSKTVLLHTTVAIDESGQIFSDHDVHHVLERWKIPKIKKESSTEWFRTDINYVKKAIEAVKKREYSKPNIDGSSKIVFRREQKEVITRTIDVFDKHNKMLWNAKMRFGKTLCALEVVKSMGVQKTLIITHRPIVQDGWFKEFDNIFYENTHTFGSKGKGETIENLKSNSKPFVYFASIQDLRGSSEVSDTGKDKNRDIFNIDWDLIIIDEAHEGTATELAKEVISKLEKPNTKRLELSGTPFNLVDNYDESQVFTWDYVMEQRAKKDWVPSPECGINPYGDLPELKMFVYSLSNIPEFEKFTEKEKYFFNFSEFFKTDENKKFIYETYVKSFLDLICSESKYKDFETNMPFSTEEYRHQLRHTLWTLPSRDSGVALEGLLRKHPVFKEFNIANLCKDSNNSETDIQKIKNAISDRPEDTYSITLTVRKATVGVTVKEWTGIFVLNNTESATTYLQSIFRVQSPYNGAMGKKEKAYVFDFAPDRFLNMYYETAKTVSDQEIKTFLNQQPLGKLLNYIPVLGIYGSSLEAFNLKEMLERVNNVLISKAVDKGFEYSYLYNDIEKFTEEDDENFRELENGLGKWTSSKGWKIAITNEGLDKPEYEGDIAEKNSINNSSLEEQKTKKESFMTKREELMMLLNNISVRLPWLAYICDFDSENITLEEFINKISDEIWNDFFPKAISKSRFLKLKKYYNLPLLTASICSVSKRVKEFNSTGLDIKKRIEGISSLLSSFKSVDRNSISAPFIVVNDHINKVFGGFNFDSGEWTDNDLFSYDSKILEIDSKTGLYLLHLAYSIYWKLHKSKNEYDDYELWNKIITNNIFGLTRTLTSMHVIKRTVFGNLNYSTTSTNIVYIQNLLYKLDNKEFSSIKDDVINKLGLGIKGFDLVIGNPSVSSINTNDNNEKGISKLYQSFFYLSKELSNQYISLTFPSNKFFKITTRNESFIHDVVKDDHLYKLIMRSSSEKLFPQLNGKPFLYIGYNKIKKSECEIDNGESEPYKCCLNKGDWPLIIPYKEMSSIVNRLNLDANLSSICSKYDLYELTTDLFHKPSKYGYTLTENKIDSDDIKIRGLYNRERVDRYISRNMYKSKIDKSSDINQYMNSINVLIAATLSQEYGSKISELEISDRGELSTGTFLVLGKFNNRYEAESLCKYIKTKFFRSLLGLCKIDRHVTKKSFRLIPLQDFTQNSDIDWTKSISEIDNQLYKKYGLSHEEIKFIEKKVELMQ